MSDITKPDDPSTKEVGSIGEGNATKDNGSEPEARKSGGPIESPNSPGDSGNPTDAEKKSRQWWDNTLKVIPIIISFIALGVSFGSCYGSNRSVGIAEKALKTTIENFQFDQRAWMNVKSIEVLPEIKEGVNLVFKTNLVNSGKTSTQNTQTIIGARTMLKDNPFVPDYGGKANTSIPRSTSSVGAGMPIQPQVMQFVLTQEQVAAFSLGETIAYVYGEVSYYDVFDHPHCTIYCYFFVSDFSSPTVCHSYNKQTDTKCDNIP